MLIIFYLLALFQFLIGIQYLFPDLSLYYESYIFDILLLGLLPFIKIRKIEKYFSRADKYIISLFAFYTFVSFLTTENSILTYIIWLRSHFKYIILFLFILSVNKNIFKKIDHFFNKKIYYLFFIQLLLQSYQIFILKPGNVDYCAGTIGSLNLLLMDFVILGKLYELYNQKKINVLLFLGSLFILFVSLYLSETKSGVILFFPMTLYGVFLLTKKRNYNAKKRAILIIIVIFVIFSAIYNLFSLDQVNYFHVDYYKYGQVNNYFARVAPGKIHVGRIATYKILFEYLTTSFTKILFGYGNTSLFDSFFPSYDGHYNEIVGTTFYVLIPNIVFNMGMIGLLLYLLFYFRFYIKVEKNIVMQLVFVIYILTAFFNNAWIVEFYGFIFWGFFAHTLRMNFNFQSRRNKKLGQNRYNIIRLQTQETLH